MSGEAIVQFWFGLEPKLWFTGGASLDKEIRSRFRDDVERALQGELESWADSVRGRLALVLLLDQFTRNVYRNQPEAFSGDSRALRYASAAVDSGQDRSLEGSERYFLYMPFEHAEDRRAQERAVALFKNLHAEAPADTSIAFLSNGVSWAERHCAVIARFGRFPSRNKVLGRVSTAQEQAFLRANPTGF